MLSLDKWGLNRHSPVNESRCSAIEPSLKESAVMRAKFERMAANLPESQSYGTVPVVARITSVCFISAVLAHEP